VIADPGARLDTVLPGSLGSSFEAARGPQAVAAVPTSDLSITITPTPPRPSNQSLLVFPRPGPSLGRAWLTKESRWEEPCP